MRSKTTRDTSKSVSRFTDFEWKAWGKLNLDRFLIQNGKLVLDCCSSVAGELWVEDQGKAVWWRGPENGLGLFIY
jgi:hypothetical protein